MAAFTCAAIFAYASPPEPIRIDGSSVNAFQRTHAAVVRSLAASEQVRLNLVEASLHSCATTRAQPDHAGALREVVPLEAVRTNSNGMAYLEITKFAADNGCKVKVGFISETASNESMTRARIVSASLVRSRPRCAWVNERNAGVPWAQNGIDSENRGRGAHSLVETGN